MSSAKCAMAPKPSPIAILLISSSSNRSSYLSSAGSFICDAACTQARTSISLKTCDDPTRVLFPFEPRAARATASHIPYAPIGSCKWVFKIHKNKWWLRRTEASACRLLIMICYEKTQKEGSARDVACVVVAVHYLCSFCGSCYKREQNEFHCNTEMRKLENIRSRLHAS